MALFQLGHMNYLKPLAFCHRFSTYSCFSSIKQYVDFQCEKYYTDAIIATYHFFLLQFYIKYSLRIMEKTFKRNKSIIELSIEDKWNSILYKIFNLFLGIIEI